jgi:hypothetical protein
LFGVKQNWPIFVTSIRFAHHTTLKINMGRVSSVLFSVFPRCLGLAFLTTYHPIVDSHPAFLIDAQYFAAMLATAMNWIARSQPDGSVARTTMVWVWASLAFASSMYSFGWDVYKVRRCEQFLFIEEWCRASDLFLGC